MISSPCFVPYLTAVGRPLAITVIVHYGIKAVVLLAAAIVAMRTENDARRSAGVEIVRIVCRGWPWPPGLPPSLWIDKAARHRTDGSVMGLLALGPAGQTGK
jgi:hypothetical protein